MALGVFGIATPIVLTACKKTTKMKKINKIASLVGVGLFIAFTCLLTLTETVINSKYIGINFSQSSQWFSKTFIFDFAHLNLEHSVLNFLMLTPLGIMSSQYFIAIDAKHPILKGMFTGLLTSTFIEVMQCILPISRTPDIADIVFNTTGTFVGALGTTTYSKIVSFMSNKTKNKTADYKQSLQKDFEVQNVVQINKNMKVESTIKMANNKKINYVNFYKKQDVFERKTEDNASNQNHDIQSSN